MVMVISVVVAVVIFMLVAIFPSSLRVKSQASIVTLALVHLKPQPRRAPGRRGCGPRVWLGESSNNRPSYDMTWS